MPEVVTKHPDVVKEVLASAGAQCGTGAPQRILTRCPREQFCALPGGEICVYSVSDAGRMTQLSKAELCEATGSVPRDDPTALAGAGLVPLLAAAVALWLRR